MNRPLRLAAVVAVLASTATAAERAGPRLLRAACGECHFDGAAEGGIAIDSLLERRSAPDSAQQTAWVRVWRNLQAHTMPPADEPQPSADDRRALVAFVLGDVLGVDPAEPDPGNVGLRRLNRVEYANTVRDLTGIDEPFAAELPADDSGHGFDTVGGTQTLSPLLTEKYLALAARVGERVAAEAAAGRDGNAYPKHLERVFPFGPPPATDEPRHLERTVRRLAERAFRRPVDEASLERLVAVATVAAGDSFEQRIGAAVTAVLASPRFLLRVEAVEPRDARDGRGRVRLDEFSLASRLSYFLWSTMPDEELLDLARSGRLRAELPRQVVRMVADPRAEALATNFVGQWLRTRDVEALPFDLRRILGEPDLERAERMFPPSLRQAMREETEMLFTHLLREGLPAIDLLVGRRSFLNGPLARFYGVEGVRGNEMRLVDLPADSPRGGLLTQASFLLVTSNPTRTSPVKRGLFILDNLLGAPPPPPPPDIPPLERAAESLSADAPMREVMERHRRDATCAACHARMDPLGLALERYDALGRWRDDPAAGDTVTAGRLVTGEEFADPQELAAVIAGPRRRDFHRCLAEKLLTYALGRGVQYFDAPAVDIMVEELERDGRLATLVQAVVASVPFQFTRPAEDQP